MEVELNFKENTTAGLNTSQRNKECCYDTTIGGMRYKTAAGAVRHLFTLDSNLDSVYSVGTLKILTGKYITHDGDTDTYFGFPAADQYCLYVGGWTFIQTIKTTQSTLILNSDSQDIDTSIYSAIGSSLFVEGSTGKVGLGLAVPATLDSTVHIVKASAGTVTAANYTVLTVESNDTAYISILTPNNKQGGILIGDTDDASRSSLLYNHNTDLLSISAGGVGAFFIEASVSIKCAIGQLGGGGDCLLHVWNASAGAVTAATGTVLCVENNSTAYLSFLTTSADAQGLVFGNAADNDIGWLKYQHNAAGANGYISFGANATEQFVVSAGGAALSASVTTVIGSDIHTKRIYNNEDGSSYLNFEAASLTLIFNQGGRLLLEGKQITLDVLTATNDAVVDLNLGLTLAGGPTVASRTGVYFKNKSGTGTVTATYAFKFDGSSDFLTATAPTASDVVYIKCLYNNLLYQLKLESAA